MCVYLVLRTKVSYMSWLEGHRLCRGQQGGILRELGYLSLEVCLYLVLWKGDSERVRPSGTAMDSIAAMRSIPAA
jgi:hypothetical protein